MTDNEFAEVDRLTATLTKTQNWGVFIALPAEVGEDSPTVEAFIVDVWRRPVTRETLPEFYMAFKEWVLCGYCRGNQG